MIKDGINIAALIVFLTSLFDAAGCTKEEKVEEFPESYSGIGVELEIKGDFPVVKKVFSGGPAESVGLKKGDIVLAIDGVSVKKLSLGDVVMMIRGPTGSQIVLAITGKGRPEKLLLPIKRGELVKEDGEVKYKKQETNNPYSQGEEKSD
ncbi:MAG: hypothetical protein Kow0090_05570 [Myxococcota bacterium]